MSKDPLDWKAENLSKGYYADYISPTMVDGVGVRGSLYVSGCPFNCTGCYNKQVQSFTYGKPFTDEVADMIIADLSKETMQGLSILGGEPMLNTQILVPLVDRIHEEVPKADIWLWTGYTYEQLKTEPFDSDKSRLLRKIDVLVDGKFEQDKFRPDLAFRGSWNQRIIDLEESYAYGEARLWKNGKYLDNENHTPINKLKNAPKK